MNLKTLQSEVAEWSNYNFRSSNTDGDVLSSATGVAEETGEMMRCVRKAYQGIRGTKEEWYKEAEKEAADIVISLCDLCAKMEIDLDAALQERWLNVKKRDWVKNPQGHGLPQ